jgi:DNA invertase Pin-like site-specific DNA recombinase
MMGMNRTVTVIPARISNRTSDKEDSKQKLRVAAYCRVSTDSEEQASSYDVQIAHYTSYINSNPEWELAGIFADDGISGTNTKKREEFNRMIEACMEGKIDMVITKSISRFARNTLDCLKYIRQLKDKNIPVFFEKENINTMDSKGEIMLTIMASLAQQESQSLSQNVKLGIQYRYQQGEVQVNHNRFLGYTKDENKRLVIVPEEAEVIKRIYREYLEGASLIQIARGLEADGILTAAKKPKWRPESIKKILQNEKYIGDALLQKTYTVDFLSKKRVVNNGIVPQYYVENSHEPIIPREIFMQVQEELVRRANLYTGKNGKKRVYSSKYALSSIVFCSECCEIYRRVHWNNRGCRSIVWRCVSRLEEKGSDCTSPTVNEEVLQAAVVRAINELLVSKDAFLTTLQTNIETVLNEEHDNSTIHIDTKLEELQKELLRLANSKADYEEVANEIYRLREQKQNALIENAEREGRRQRIAELTDFLKEQSWKLEEYDEQLVRKLIEKVTVFEGKLTVEFKSGVELDIEI